MTSPPTLSRRRFLCLSGLALSTALVPSLSLAASKKSFPMPERKPRPPRVLMLDPGHGGRDPGATGLHGTHEKDVVLDIAKRMATLLKERTGVAVRLTREDDEFLPLLERVKRGRDAEADLFLSIHADSAPNSAARGLSVYTLSDKATDDFTAKLAHHENNADRMGGMDLPTDDKEVSAILMDLAARRAHDTAQHVRAAFVESVGKKWPLLERPMRAANFVVLRAPDMASMLVETGFLSNPKDEQNLRLPQQRDKIAQLMAHNIGGILDGEMFG